MVSAPVYYNAVTWPLGSGQATAAEPWLAPTDSEPLERTVLVFVSHPGFVGRVAVRGGSHFNTRVTYLEGPPIPAVELGDPRWDVRWVTLAESVSEAHARLPWGARELLSRWGFSGHLELRPGRLIVHFAGTRPEPDHLERLLPAVAELTAAITKG
jgi:hypothetical protein